MGLTDLLDALEYFSTFESNTKWCALRLYALSIGADLGMIAHLLATWEECNHVAD